VRKKSILWDYFSLNVDVLRIARAVLSNHMSTNFARGLVVCILSSLVISCASTGEVNQSAKAKIYVLRRLSVLGGGGIAISDNGKSIGTIHRGGIVTWDREPGRVVIAASAASEAKMTLVVKANEVYYLESKATHGTAEHPKAVELGLLSQRDGLRLLRTLQERRTPL
jgi:hypothetical protein